MRKVYEYSHLGGSKILQIHYSEIAEEIDKVITENGYLLDYGNHNMDNMRHERVSNDI